MKDSVRIAAASVESRPGEIASNLVEIDAWCRKASEQNADLILFPELSLSGFVPNHPTGDHEAWLRSALGKARAMAQPLDSEAVNELISIAGQYDLLISTGMLEDAGNVMYNTQVLVSASGLVGSWRKMHIPMFEMPFYIGGGVPQVVDTPLGRIGGNICFDALLPESTRLLAVQNVEIVLFPFAADPPPKTPAGWAAWAGTALRARCAENGVFGVAVNYAGHVECAGVEQTFPGGAMVVGPRGEVLVAHESAELMVMELHRADLLAARSEPEYLYRFRRPELYRTLAD